MANILMADIAMANILMADIVMADIVMADIVMAEGGGTHVVVPGDMPSTPEAAVVCWAEATAVCWPLLYAMQVAVVVVVPEPHVTEHWVGAARTHLFPSNLSGDAGQQTPRG